MQEALSSVSVSTLNNVQREVEPTSRANVVGKSQHLHLLIPYHKMCQTELPFEVRIVTTTVSIPILSAVRVIGPCDTGPRMLTEVISLSVLGSACAEADCLYLHQLTCWGVTPDIRIRI